MPTDLPYGDELRAALGPLGRVRLLDSSPRSRVWRAEASGSPVVVKQLVDSPQADDAYAREVAALRLASRVEPPVVPRLLGTDPGARTLVLEYVAQVPAADDWVIGYATALARLHAATRVPCDDGADPGGGLPAWAGPRADDIDAFLRLARALGVTVPSGTDAELAALVDRLSHPPGQPALLHGDPCPGNDLHTAHGVRFIDFEQASLGDGLVELAYLRIGFPTCWCVTETAPPLLAAAEAAYRTAWHDATGTEVRGDLTDACAGWALRGDALVERAHRGTVDQLARIPDDDWRWGTATARQRLAHRLGVVARMTAGGAGPAGFGRLSAAVREALLTRWPTLGPLPSRRPV